MDKYRHKSVHISRESVKDLLFEDFFSEAEKKVLAAFMSFKNQEASADTLAEHLGYPKIISVNAIVGKMGKRVAGRLGLPLRERKNGSEAGWDVLLEEKSEPGVFKWKLKRSVVEALSEYGIKPTFNINSSLHIFDKGDQEYFAWMKANPNGYILNTTRGENTRTFILHSSECSQIKEKKTYKTDSYTTNDYIKIASNEVWQIKQHCRKHKKNFEGVFELCKSCKPVYIVREVVYPDEIPGYSETIKEGSLKTVVVNYYERSEKARKKCIEHFGYECQCCGISFEQTYGEIGNEFIHVHHRQPVSDIGEEYEINPIEDLIPLCPNCHAMIHKQSPPYSVKELREIMRRNER